VTGVAVLTVVGLVVPCPLLDAGRCLGALTAPSAVPAEQQVEHRAERGADEQDDDRPDDLDSVRHGPGTGQIGQAVRALAFLRDVRLIRA
jgi:hypothetical protein